MCGCVLLTNRGRRRGPLRGGRGRDEVGGVTDGKLYKLYLFRLQLDILVSMRA